MHHLSFYSSLFKILLLRKNTTIHKVTTMLATSKNVLFPGHNHVLTTGTDDPSLAGTWAIIIKVLSHQYRLFAGGYDLEMGHFNTYPARPVCWSGLISDSYCSLKPLCSGMGEVVPARTSPTLLPPYPRTVLSLSCFKVSQCINCRDWHCKS